MIRRTALLTGVVLAVCLELASAFTEPATRSRSTALALPKFLLWNASASVPRGLYWLHLPDDLHVGDLVAVEPPRELADYMAARGYLPNHVPLLKHIGALTGQTVCRFGRTVTIHGETPVHARERDTRGRLLPVWYGCRQLRAGEVFVLNPDIPDSFDGRYFGILPTHTIVARAKPLWTLPEQ